jgi:hypothetical protein
VLEEFYRVAFRKKIYSSLKELQQDLDHWMDRYNNQRTHQWKRCQGRTLMEAFEENLDMAKEKVWGMTERDRLTVVA